MAALLLNLIRNWGRGGVIHHISSIKPLKNFFKNPHTHLKEVAAPAKTLFKLTMKYKSALFYIYI